MQNKVINIKISLLSQSSIILFPLFDKLPKNENKILREGTRNLRFQNGKALLLQTTLITPNRLKHPQSSHVGLVFK